MSLTFHHLPPIDSRTLADRAPGGHRAAEKVAIEALERGLAFDDSFDEGAADSPSAESPSFDEVLRAFAAMAQP